MNSYSPLSARAVKLTGAAQITGIPTEIVESPESRRAVVAGLVLRSQAPVRLFAAVLLAAVRLLILFRTTGPSAIEAGASTVTVILGLYIVGLVATHYSLWRNARSGEERVTLVFALDVAFIFAMFGATSSPVEFHRALFALLVVVHLANHFFGGRHAWQTIQMGIIGYLGLLYFGNASARIDVVNELVTLAVATVAMSVMVRQAGGVRRRLSKLVTLFENVEDGDFTQTYDVIADRQPDEITRVGQAYNRVRAQLSSMVLTDPLTGCLNRRGFDQALAREVARATRTGDSFALIAIDLDHFKSINDTHGHMAGDTLLREVGAILLAAGRGGDVVARMGGEEFALLLPGSGHSGANLFAARLCDRIRAHEFVIDIHGQRIALTTSIGVAVGGPLGEPNFAALLWSRADAALYAAKRAGRDCARAWMDETEYSGEHVVIGSLSRRAARSEVSFRA